jgi:HK97 family phage major capsid protein
MSFNIPADASLLGLQSAPQQPQHTRIAAPFLSAKEIASYSLVRAIEAARLGSWRDAGFERELSKFLLSTNGDIDVDHPNRLMAPAAVFATRDLNATTAGQGGYLVGTEVVGVVDAVRAKSVVMRLGAQLLPGLRHNCTYAVMASGATATWLANETTSASESTPITGQIALAAKTVGAYIETSRLINAQGGELAEFAIRRNLANSLAAALDAAALDGTGTSGQPLGVMRWLGIGSFNGASITYANVLDAQSGLLTANGLDGGGEVSFVCRPAVAKILAARQGFSTLIPLWVGALNAGQLAGCRAESTMSMPATTLAALDASKILIGEWGTGIELQVNPYANFQAGITGVRAMLTVDVGLLNVGGVSVATSVS